MVTRLYFPFTEPAPISPTQDAGWEDTDGLLRRRLAHIKGASALADGTSIVYTTTQDGLDRQYISYPMKAGISFTGATVTMQIMAKESAINDDATSRLGIRILSRDGATVRQTLYSVIQHGTESEYTTTNRNKTFANGGVVTGSYQTVDGDRLCVEVGHSDTIDAGVSIAVTCNFGEVGTDLPVDETTTSGNGWIEFSNTITFQPEAIPQPYIYKQYEPTRIRDAKEKKRGRKTNPLFSAWKQILPVASTPILDYIWNPYKKHIPSWLRQEKKDKSGKRTTRLFDAWKAIFPAVAEPDFTSVDSGYQVVKSRRRLTKFFARRYSRLREFLPVPEIPTRVDLKTPYYSYIPTWLKKDKSQAIRIPETPKYSSWEFLFNLLRIQKVKPKIVIDKREPINRPTPKYEFWENLIKLLRRPIKTQPRVIRKREPVIRVNPRFSAWVVFFQVVAAPLISYIWNPYKSYLPNWIKKSKREIVRVTPAPPYTGWFNLIRLLRRELPKSKQWIVKREPVDVPNPQFNSAWLLRLLRQPIFRFRQIWDKREPIIRQNPRYIQWQFLFNIFKNIQKPKPLIVKREPIIKPSPKYSAWVTFLLVVAVGITKTTMAIITKRTSSAIWDTKRTTQTYINKRTTNAIATLRSIIAKITKRSGNIGES